MEPILLDEREPATAEIDPELHQRLLRSYHKLPLDTRQRRAALLRKRQLARRAQNAARETQRAYFVCARQKSNTDVETAALSESLAQKLDLAEQRRMWYHRTRSQRPFAGKPSPVRFDPQELECRLLAASIRRNAHTASKIDFALKQLHRIHSAKLKLERANIMAKQHLDASLQQAEERYKEHINEQRRKATLTIERVRATRSAQAMKQHEAEVALSDKLDKAEQRHLHQLHLKRAKAQRELTKVAMAQRKKADELKMLQSGIQTRQLKAEISHAHYLRRKLRACRKIITRVEVSAILRRRDRAFMDMAQRQRMQEARNRHFRILRSKVMTARHFGVLRVDAARAKRVDRHRKLVQRLSMKESLATHRHAEYLQSVANKGRKVSERVAARRFREKKDRPTVTDIQSKLDDARTRRETILQSRRNPPRDLSSGRAR